MKEGTVVDVVVPASSNDAAPLPLGEASWGDVFEDVIGKAEGLPSDLARNHDHYIHGASKR